jgi:hypothetical protein
MRPAGLIPSFSLIGLRSPAPSTREGSRCPSRSPVPARPSARSAAVRDDCQCVPITGPEGCSPRSLLSRRLAASPAETLRQRLHGRVHSPPASLADYSSARFACPPSRENLRAGFPCALGHPWLVTLAPANWGPVFLRTRDVRHRGYQDYAGRKFCLENKLCTSCANELEI